MKRFAILILPCIAAVLNSCETSPAAPVERPTVYAIKAPATGNYPQGLYKYPHRQNTASAELFGQTLEWIPPVQKTFAADTQYTAELTLAPASPRYTFDGVLLEDIQGLPEDNVVEISSSVSGSKMTISIVFEKTALQNAEPKLLFDDDFDGTALDGEKWATCPNWDRQGRSTWDSNMVSVGGGNLRLGFKRDAALGRSKSSSAAISNNWIRAGAIRTRPANGDDIFFENTFGYYESRIKFPKVSGMWGAFWLMSPTQWILTDGGKIGTEIDIVESIANPENSFNAALHWDGYGSSHKSVGSDEDLIPAGINIYDGEFHVFALDWSPSEYIFYVDGVEFWRCDGGASFRNVGINQNPNYIKLTVEGADWAGSLPADFTEGEMLVDYVRVYNQPKVQL
jgi:beta-glucanase (GH16 family)